MSEPFDVRPEGEPIFDLLARTGARDAFNVFVAEGNVPDAVNLLIGVGIEPVRAERLAKLAMAASRAGCN